MLQVAVFFGISFAMKHGKLGGPVMFRIILNAQTAQEAALEVYGKLDESSFHLFKQEVTRHWRTTPRLVLDLDGVPFIDEASLVLLQQWTGPRLALRGGSPFLRALLAAEGLEIDE